MRLTSTQNRLRILLVEDSKGDALLVQSALNAALPSMHSLHTVHTIDGAIKAIADEEFEVALLDRSLPDAEGFSGLYSLQNMSPKLPIVFLTAYADETTALDAIEHGAQDYLFKDKIDGHVIRRAIQYAVLRKQFEGVLIMRANFDVLTGLANRQLFESRMDMALARAKRHGGGVCVMFMDLDGFKQVNDTYGHAAGDQLLKEIGQRLKKALRSYDTVARLGGDEFAILLEGVPGTLHMEAKKIAEKVIQQLNTPFHIRGNELVAKCSIGIAVSAPREYAVTSQQLLSQADAAMYQGKSSGNTWRMNVDETEPVSKVARN